MFIRIRAYLLADPLYGPFDQGLRTLHYFHARLGCYRLEQKLPGGFNFTLPLESRAFPRRTQTGSEAHRARMKQIARNLTDCEDGFLLGYERLIHDQGTVLCEGFRETLGQGGVKTIRLPRRFPNLNAYPERCVQTFKENCLDQMISIEEKSLGRAVGEFVEYYNVERTHQGLENNNIEPRFEETRKNGVIVRESRLGRMLKYYYRKIA